jgi:two-component system, NtrC family, sensor kinase
MRFGVSAKVFLAYAVLLVAFAATSLFSLAYLHNAQQEVAANVPLLDLQNTVDASWRHLMDFEQSGASKPARAGAYFDHARGNLASAAEAIDRFLEQQARSARRKHFEEYRAELGRLERLTAAVQPEVGPYLSGRKEPFATNYGELKSGVDLFKKRLHRDALEVADQLREKETRAFEAAIFLGLAGLLVAIAAALLMWRTLRPLYVLRLRARQIAGGEYGRRIGVRSRDEIGDLAREFDAMAQALEEREQRLIRSERLAAVGKIAAQITHEIRNPLASLGLYAELLADELPPGEREGRRLLTAISAEVDRLSEITESYLRFVRLPKPKLEPEDLGALVTSVLEFARAELAQSGVALNVEVAPGLPDIAADENQLRQALLNLVRNAREALAATGGVLRVAVDGAPDGRVRLTVADTGPGIPPEHVGKIFDPFFSTKEKGTGLGLALVQQIVAEHGGRIEVDSPPGRGTTFVITFPPLVRPEATGAEEASSGGFHTETQRHGTFSAVAPPAR